MSTRINLHERFPLVYQDENRVLLNNGNIVYGFRIVLPEVFTLSANDYDQLHTCWYQAFKLLSPGVVVHKQDVFIKKQFDPAHMPDQTFLARATRNYFKNCAYQSHDSYLFFTWPGNRNFNKPAVVNPFGRFKKTALESMEATTNRIGKEVNEAVSFLENSRYFKIEALSENEILQESLNYFNGYNIDIDTDISGEGKNLLIGDFYYGLLAINHEKCFSESVQTSKIHPKFSSYHDPFSQGWIDALGSELPGNHLVNQIIYLDDRQRWLGILNKRREELKKSAGFGSQNKVILQRLEKILFSIQSDDLSRICRGQVQLIGWERTRELLQKQMDLFKSHLREIEIRPYQPVGDALMDYFLKGFWGFSTEFSNDDLYVTDLRHALCLWINNSVYRNDHQGIYFNDRLHGIPVRKDVWDESKLRIRARNFAIFAPTGEGKSFLANHILRQFFEQGLRLVIIDLGGSYSKFARLYPADFVVLRYEQGSNLGINPFYIKGTPSPEQLEDLTDFLLELTASESTAVKEYRVALKQHLVRYYEVAKTNSLEGFCQFLENDRGERITSETYRNFFDPEHFLHVISEFRKGGLYEFLFEEEDRMYRLEDKRLIVFELDEVRDNKEILSVMLKLIKSAIQRTIWRNRSEKGIVLFDEFAKQLKFDNVLESVEFYYQAIRKQNGAIGIILQSINQLPENSTAASILENTQVIYSLRNEKGYKAIKKRLNLTDHELSQLHSIRNQLKGARRYTEFFLKIGKESNIYRLEVPPEVYAAYLTEGKESDEIMKHYQCLGDMEKSIEQFLKQKE